MEKLGGVVGKLAPFWGSPTSTIDWCEPNYQFSRFVAEPYNTFSNLSFVLLGLLGAAHEYSEKAKRSYVLMYFTVSAIGLGSMAFHGTLTYLGQQLDELPMVWFLLGSMFVVNNDSLGSAKQKGIVSALLLVYAVVFSAAHIILKTTTAFQVHFGSLLGLVLLRVYQRFRKTDIGQQGRQVIGLFVASGLLAFAFWLADYNYCTWFADPKNWPFQFMPNGHVFWHLLMGYSAYCSVVMLKVLEASEKSKPIELRYRLGIPLAYKVGEYDLESSLKTKGSQIF